MDYFIFDKKQPGYSQYSKRTFTATYTIDKDFRAHATPKGVTINGKDNDDAFNSGISKGDLLTLNIDDGFSTVYKLKVIDIKFSGKKNDRYIKFKII